MTERISDERLVELIELQNQRIRGRGAVPEVKDLRKALDELQERRARDTDRDEHGLPTRLGAAIRFEGLANVFVRHSTYLPYPWTDGQAFLASEEVLEIGEGCGPWKVVQDDE